MPQVARNRGMAQVGCMVSSPRYPLGTRLWVYGLRTGVLLHCEVVDVSAPRDKARHIRTHRVVELDWAVTQALCGATMERADHCPVVVVKPE